MYRARRRAIALGIIGLLAAGVSACGGGNDSSGAASGEGGSKTVTLGLLAPMTGQSAADGQLMQRGAQLAIDDINKAGGVAGYKLRLKTLDVQGQKSDVVARDVQEFVGDSSIKAVVTGYASTTNFEINPLAQAGMPYIIAASSDQTKAIIGKAPGKYPTVWSLAPAFDGYGTELPKFVEQLGSDGKVDLRNKKAFIVTSDNPYSKGISNGLKQTLTKLGWTIAGQETVPLGPVNDWGSVLSKIRAADPDLIVNTDYLPANDATFMKQFVQNPTRSVVFIQYGPSVPEFLKLTKDVSTGVLYNQFGAYVSPKWNQQQAVKEYKAKYHEDPGPYAPFMFDAINVYAAALKKVGNPDDKPAIGKAIGALDMDISFGHLSFDPATHLARAGADGIPLVFLQIRNGAREVVAPEALKTSDFQTPPWMR